jgi:adenosylmethionine-8-amino-7-oxononanoate aminotransferase
VGYLQHKGSSIAARLLEQGIFIRPLGNVIYLMPPYCITREELEGVYAALKTAIMESE